VILLLTPSQDFDKQPLLEDQGQAKNPKDKAGQLKMKEKLEEASKKSKAKKREEFKGQWWPCDLTESDLKYPESEGFIKVDSSRVVPKASVPLLRRMKGSMTYWTESLHEATNRSLSSLMTAHISPVRFPRLKLASTLTITCHSFDFV
jgi:hypothetical protein